MAAPLATISSYSPAATAGIVEALPRRAPSNRKASRLMNRRASALR
ncbi:Uncharacterised protein [Bordetella pertussis]|nr:Uncharacterised protein [Bordetella pertussis]